MGQYSVEETGVEVRSDEQYRTYGQHIRTNLYEYRVDENNKYYERIQTTSSRTVRYAVATIWETGELYKSIINVQD